MSDISRDDLQAVVDSVIDRVDERFEAERRFVDARHQENKDMRDEDRALMQQIHAEVRATNGRVTTLEANVRELFAKLKDLVAQIGTVRVSGVNLKQVIQWASVAGGTWYVLTQVLGFHK